MEKKLEKISFKTPGEEWAYLLGRMERLDETGTTINRTIIDLLPDTDERLQAWREISKKAKELYGSIIDGYNLGLDPGPEIYELLKEVENGMKKFVN